MYDVCFKKNTTPKRGVFLLYSLFKREDDSCY